MGGWYQYCLAHFMLLIRKAPRDNRLVVHPAAILGGTATTLRVEMPLKMRHPLSVPTYWSTQTLYNVRDDIAFVLFSSKKAVNYKQWRI